MILRSVCRLFLYISDASFSLLFALETAIGGVPRVTYLLKAVMFGRSTRGPSTRSCKQRRGARLPSCSPTTSPDPIQTVPSLSSLRQSPSLCPLFISVCSWIFRWMGLPLPTVQRLAC